MSPDRTVSRIVASQLHSAAGAQLLGTLMRAVPSPGRPRGVPGPLPLACSPLTSARALSRMLLLLLYRSPARLSAPPYPRTPSAAAMRPGLRSRSRVASRASSRERTLLRRQGQRVAARVGVRSRRCDAPRRRMVAASQHAWRPVITRAPHCSLIAFPPRPTAARPPLLL